jgi:hypothetical protein
VQITPVTPARLVEEVVDLVDARAGRVRVALDGPPPARPLAVAGQVADALRTRGRMAVVVSAEDFLRPASVRLEFGREDPDEFLDRWLDDGGLRREVLGPSGPGGSGRVLPRLWDAAADRAHRDTYVALAGDGVVLLAGSLLLGRGLPLDLSVHFRMSDAALARTLPADQRWTLPAYRRYADERFPEAQADLVVLSDHPTRPALRR